MDSFMFSIKSRKCQEPPRTDKSQTPTNADLQSTYYNTLSTKLDTPRRTLPTIRGRRCSRRMAHSDSHLETERRTTMCEASVALAIERSAASKACKTKTWRGATRPRQDENETRRDGLVYKRGARPSRRPSGHAALFSHRFSDLFFAGLFLDFGLHFGSILDNCSCFLHPFFEHQICIDFL